MTARSLRRAIAAGFALSATSLLGGCFGVLDHPAVSADSVDLAAPVAAAEIDPPLRTVRRSGSRVADAGDDVPRGAALPTPNEIFDFHPRGAKRDSWRQPFIIDPNDGPLAGYVRRMDAELTESNAQTKAAALAPVRKKVCPSGGPAGTIAASCGENDVARSLAK